MLLLQQEMGGNEFYCQACPFVSRVQKHTKKTKFTPKQVDDVLGGKQDWENVDSIQVECPKCGHNRAYYMQIQIRSADEPSSLFYKVSLDLSSAVNVVMTGEKGNVPVGLVGNKL
jgi:DNA-directed RNA polymerase III subunit RPC11